MTSCILSFIFLIHPFLILLCSGKANRQEEYDTKSTEFETHSKKMVDTASTLAKSGVVTDRKLANDILSTAKKVSQLATNLSIIQNFHH